VGTQRGAAKMKIYHGTSQVIARKSAYSGLAPRGSKRDSNWNEQFESNPDMVYLTTTYALYFACVATKQSNIAVIEIETDRLDKKKFYPDEDFICEVVRRQNTSFRTKEQEKKLHEYVRNNLDRFQGNWSESLKILGNICYKGVIPAVAITRYATFDLAKDSGILAISMMDPVVCATNHEIFGKFYRQFIAWLFDDVRELPHVKEGMDTLARIEEGGEEKEEKGGEDTAGLGSDMAIHFEKQVELFRELQKKRDGIRIVNL